MAGGGSSATSDGVAEIKRMYVVPAARRQGLGRRLLEALEDKARELGYARDPARHRRRASRTRRRCTSAPATTRSTNYNGNSMASFWGEKILR